MSLILDGTNGLSDVDGTAGTPAIRGSDANTGVFFGTDIVGVSTGGTERMRVDASGNVGIGTSSPTFGLSVQKDNGSGYVASFRKSASDPALTIQTTGGVTQIQGLNSALTDVSNIAMQVSGGNLLVGTTSQIFGSNFINNIVGTRPLAIKNTSTTAGDNSEVIWHVGTTGDNRFIEFGTEASYTLRGSIDYNRGAGLTRYNTTSDATLKNIIGDSDGQKSVEILNSTRIREYAWKDDETQKLQVGVIAQELYETYKGAVSVGGDIEKTDEEGNVTTEYRPWGVDKTAFTFHLIAGWQSHEKMIQELKAINDAQAQTIESLTARVVALENQIV